MAFEASVPEIAKFSGDMKLKYDTIAKMINDAEQRAVAVAGKSFTGAAGGAFQNVMVDYLQSARKLNDALMDNAGKVESVAKTIDNEEIATAQTITALNM